MTRSSEQDAPPIAVSPQATFPRQIAQAMLALALSALVLALGYATLNSSDRDQIAPLDVLSGSQFRAIAGTVQRTGKGIEVTGFQPQGQDRQAIVTFNQSFNAETFPLLAYALGDTPPSLRVEVIWRLASEPQQMYFASLGNEDGVAETTVMSEHPKWQGQVTEIALRLSGRHRADSVAIEEFTLHAADWHTTLSSLWSQWTAYRGWTLSSINTLYGTADRQALSPAMAMACWAGLAVIVLTLLMIPKLEYRPVAYVAVILVPWISLDLLWQGELNAQLKETRRTFSGKTIEQKHLADVDHETYRYARHLTEEALPPTASRIFILHEASGHNFQRLKMQYYLLPHNIYNFDRTPPPGSLRPGDFILALGEVPGLKFDATTNELSLKRHKLPVTVVDAHPDGSLYQVAPKSHPRTGAGG